MSVQLLDKTRKINKLLHNSSSSKVVFNDICQVLMASYGTMLYYTKIYCICALNLTLLQHQIIPKPRWQTSWDIGRKQ